MTEKCRKKSSDEFRRQLAQLIEEEEMREKEDDLKPQVGTKLRHKLEDEDNETELWYEGKVVEVTENTLTISYTGYNENFTWSWTEIQQDIERQDLLFL